jgi:hypothetical protein
MKTGQFRFQPFLILLLVTRHLDGGDTYIELPPPQLARCV